VFSFRLNHAVGGLRPFGYHLVNVALHAAVAALVVLVAVRAGCSSGGGALAGLLFAAMPIHTEAVANVVGRAELLAALFALLAVLLALNRNPRERAGVSGPDTPSGSRGSQPVAGAPGSENGHAILRHGWRREKRDSPLRHNSPFVPAIEGGLSPLSACS
jgi:hypothetical protein